MFMAGDDYNSDGNGIRKGGPYHPSIPSMSTGLMVGNPN